MVRNLLFLLFLALPGLGFQALGGFVGIAYTIVFCSTAGLEGWEMGLLLIPVAVFAVGATMQAIYDSIRQVHLSTAEALTAVAQKTCAFLALLALAAAMILAARGKQGEAITAIVLLVMSCTGFATCVVRRRKLLRQSLEDLPEEPAS